jgi:hypothetical protein
LQRESYQIISPPKVYNKCIFYNSPHLLLRIFIYYMGYGDILNRLFGDEKFYPYWTSLLGEARNDFLIFHDLGEILLFKEQALFLAYGLTPTHYDEQGREIKKDESFLII